MGVALVHAGVGDAGELGVVQGVNVVGSSDLIPYIKKAFANMECTIIVKIGLPVDEKYKDSDLPEKEHIWFELKDISDDLVVAELTQEPYYVSGIKEGDVASYPVSSITDWIIFTPDCRITPDDVYLLDK